MLPHRPTFAAHPGFLGRPLRAGYGRAWQRSAGQGSARAKPAGIPAGLIRRGSAIPGGRGLRFWVLWKPLMRSSSASRGDERAGSVNVALGDPRHRVSQPRASIPCTAPRVMCTLEHGQHRGSPEHSPTRLCSNSKSSQRSALGQTMRHDLVSRHRRSSGVLDHSGRRPGGTGGRPRFHGVWHPLRFRSCGTIGAVKRFCVRPGIGAVTRVCCRAGVSAFPIANAVAGVLLIKFHDSFPG